MEALTCPSLHHHLPFLAAGNSAPESQLPKGLNIDLFPGILRAAGDDAGMVSVEKEEGLGGGCVAEEPVWVPLRGSESGEG
jgi:hypothetical protein